MADKFYSAFNGRYFRDDVMDGMDDQLSSLKNEIMHTVYLSDLLLVQEIKKFDMN